MKLKFFELAKKLSQHSTHHQFKIGCAIVHGNKIVSLSFNKLKTHPKAKSPYQQLHAEIGAIIAADKKDLAGCEIYTYRQHKDGSLALSKPCIHCQSALIEAEITKVFYTTDGGYTESVLTD
jgi:deoxycytidylate deaminase